MTSKQALKLESGRPGQKVWVRGTVREVHPTGEWVEVQFSSYSLNIPSRDVRVRAAQGQEKEK
jgi:hypothetical protein